MRSRARCGESQRTIEPSLTDLASKRVPEHPTTFGAAVDRALFRGHLGMMTSLTHPAVTGSNLPTDYASRIALAQPSVDRPEEPRLGTDGHRLAGRGPLAVGADEQDRVGQPGEAHRQ